MGDDCSLTSSDVCDQGAIDDLFAKYANHDGLPQAFCWLGNDYLDARQDEKAAQCYQYVIDNSPDSNAAMSSWAGIARVHIRRGDDQAAQPVIDKLIADFNDNPEVAAAVFRIGEEYYEPAFAAENKGDVSQSKDLFRKTIAIWERIVTELPESAITPQAYYFSARCYETLGELDHAANYYQTVIHDWPDYKFCDVAHFLFARCFETLANSGSIPKEEAALMIRDTCEKLLADYPNTTTLLGFCRQA